MKLESQALTGVRWTSISTASITFIEILRTIVLARLLSPEDFGLMGMVIVVIGFIQTYTDLGMSAAIIHHQDIAREQLSSLYWLNIMTGFITFGLIWIIAPIITTIFHEPRLLPMLRVVGILFVITPIGKQFEILLQKELSFDILARQEIIASFGGLIVAILCALGGFGVWALVWSAFTQMTLRTLLSSLIGFVRYRPLLYFRRGDLKGFVGFGLFQMGERGVNYLNQRLDQVLIGSFLGAQALGFYYFASNLVTQPISRINPVITRVAFPVFSKIQNDDKKLQNGYIKVINFLTTINAPLLVGLAVVAPLGVPLLFGEKWSESIMLIQILSFVALSRSINNPVGSVQLAKGRADLGFKWNLMMLIFSVPAIYFGARLGKAVGIAMALLILQICLNIPAYLYFVRPLIGKCGGKYAAAVLKPLSVACGMGLIVMSGSYFLSGSSAIMGLFIQVVTGGLIYLFFLWVIDRRAIYEFKSALFGR